MIQTESKFYDGIEVRAQKPLDVRTIVEKREDLYKLNTWPHDTYIDKDGTEHYTIYMKEGMCVTVTGTKDNPVFDLYMLVNIDKILDQNYAGWKFIGSAGSPGNGGAMPGVGNIDGGRADEYYTPGQIINCGNAESRGETEE